ncbi:MAG: hypothetical protein AAB482_04150 [Patescibacteria group bacterium]
MRNRQKITSGFSLIEMVVVVSISTFLIATSINTYSNFSDRQRLNAAVEGTVSLIQKARSQTLASKENLLYSIHVEDTNSTANPKNFIAAYNGNNYFAPNKKIEKFSMPAGIEISDSTLTSQPGSCGDFGEVCGAGTSCPTCNDGRTCDAGFCKNSVTKTYAYVLENSYGGLLTNKRLVVIDTDAEHTPPTPVIVGSVTINTITTRNLVAINVVDGFAYILENDSTSYTSGRLLKYDVSTSAKRLSPTLSATAVIPPGGYNSDILVTGGKVYVANGEDRFEPSSIVPYIRMYDTNLNFIYNFPPVGQGTGALAADPNPTGYLFAQISGSGDAFNILKQYVPSPQSWVLQAANVIPTTAPPSNYMGGYAYNPRRMAVRKPTINNPSNKTFIYSTNEYTYASQSNKRYLSILDATTYTLTWPEFAISTDPFYTCSSLADALGCQNGLFVDDSGQYIYIVSLGGKTSKNGGKFTITSFNPSVPSLTRQSFYPATGYLPASAIKVDTAGNRAYIPVQKGGASPLGRFTVFDVSNKANPTIIGSVCTAGDSGGGNCYISNAFDFAVETASGLDPLTCANSGKGHQIDQQCCTSPDTPCLLGSCNTGVTPNMCIDPSITGQDATYQRITGSLLSVKTTAPISTSTLSTGSITIRSQRTGNTKTITLLPTGAIQVE